MRPVVVAFCATLVLFVPVLPGKAAERSRMPSSRPQILDPAGDAFYQAAGTSTPVRAGDAADVLAGWFTHDDQSLSLHVQTAAARLERNGLFYEVRADTEFSTNGCLSFAMWVPGRFERRHYVNAHRDYGHVIDQCEGVLTDEVNVSVSKGPKSTALVSLTGVPRDLSPNFDSEQTIKRPWIRVREYLQLPPYGLFPTDYTTVDETRRGRSYRLATIGSSPSDKHCERFHPVVPDSPAPNRRDALAAPLVTVTDANDRQRPITIRYRHGPSLAAGLFGTSAYGAESRFFNVQVDSDRPNVGLHALIRWARPSLDEFDLYLFDEVGRERARSTAFNQLPETEAFGYGGWGYEYIAGHRVSDCVGVTVDSRPSWTAGQSMKLKLWLGAIGAREDHT